MVYTLDHVLDWVDHQLGRDLREAIRHHTHYHANPNSLTQAQNGSDANVRSHVVQREVVGIFRCFWGLDCFQLFLAEACQVDCATLPCQSGLSLKPRTYGHEWTIANLLLHSHNIIEYVPRRLHVVWINLNHEIDAITITMGIFDVRMILEEGVRKKHEKNDHDDFPGREISELLSHLGLPISFLVDHLH